MAKKYTNWLQFNDAIESGDFSVVRDLLDRLDAEELEKLREEFGEHIVQRLSSLRRRRRGPKKGRVIVINGIMGAHLYTIDRENDADHVWIDIGSIFRGRMDRLELTPSGEQVKKKYRVEARRLHKSYIPLALELERSWDVLHFPFDWRLDMDLEAARLAGRIQEWAQGEPVHLVAHSMGGVLSRRMIGKFPSVWQSMADPDGLQRGGRLIMLGTPNRGSFAIPSMLTGKDRVVKFLALIDVGASKRRFLRNASSFPGGYQMLPSPVVDLQDDHNLLFEKQTWGKHRVIEPHLAMANRFQQELDPVISPERLVYVAGYGVKTLQRIEVRKPGKFRYEVGREGDGRVPHALGLLDSVTTQWVQEKHGDLPLNNQVLGGIHDLLQFGHTVHLETTKPVVRGFGDTDWVDDERLAEVTEQEAAAARELGESLRAARSRKSTRVPLKPSARAAADAMLDDYLASPLPTEFLAGRLAEPRRKKAKPELKVEVHWADVRRVRGDVYCVGHYEGVLPQQAEYALDTVVSRSTELEEMVLRTHTQRGLLRGQFGDVNLYPWARQHQPPRTVAVAGMGYPGQFTEAHLRSLAHHLSWAVATLPNTRTICTVLIGSGEGGLSTDQSVRNLIFGMADALESGLNSQVRTLRFVELYHHKARSIMSAVEKVSQQESRITLSIGDKVRHGQGGRFGKESALALATAALIDAKTSKAKGVASAMSLILRRIPTEDSMRESVTRELDDFAAKRETVEDIASRIRVELEPREAPRKESSRMSFWRTEAATHVAALTNTAVKPERISRLDPTLLDQLRVRLDDPSEDEITRFGSMLHRMVVPRDFGDVLLGADSMVFEIDRPMSTINWEMLTVEPDSSAVRRCVALRYAFARQLRTEYSPPPSADRPSSRGLRALVVGDPGDPEYNENLPGAREEALHVAELLKSAGVDVTLRIGAPVRGRGPISGIEPASRLAVLELLQTQSYDILHYAGHGDFQDDSGLRSGWLFKDGLLTANELSTVDSSARLVIANACLSAKTSTRMRSGERIAPEFGDAGLLPSLADEFLRRGVRDYVGTAWEIDDQGAIEFATHLYTAMDLSSAGGKQSLGRALLAARTELFNHSDRYGALWAAYQHYGDPTLKL